MVQVSPLSAYQKFLKVFTASGPKLYCTFFQHTNVSFVSSESTISTNDVSTAYVVSTSSGHSSQKEGSSLYSDELKRDGFEMASGHDFHEIEEVLQEDREKAVSTDQKEIKKAEGEMQGTLDIKQKTMEGDLENRMNLMLYNSGSNTEMSTRDKLRLGLEINIHEGLSYVMKKELLKVCLAVGFSDVEDSPVNDRFAKVEGMHVVPPPMTGIYMPSKSDFGIDESNFTYGPKQSKTSESDAKTSDFASCKTNSSVELNKKKGKGTGQGENRPVWNNVQRLNHQNQFVPTAVLTRTGRIPVNTARHNFNSQAVSTSAARKVNAVRPIVNDVRPKTVFHKTHTPIRRPFNRTTAPRTNFSNQKVNTARVKAVSAVGGIRETADDPHKTLKNKGIVDSGCSRHMTGNKAYLAEYQDYNGGPVAFGGSKGYITGKGKIKTGKLDFEDVCFVKELQHFNLFSVSQMCDKKNKVLFTDTECLVLSSDFKLPDENQVLLRIPRQNNMYSFNLENIVPFGGLACLIAKATVDESNKWHRRLGHNSKTGTLLNYMGQKGSKGNTVMLELHNKMELLRERTGPLLQGLLDQWKSDEGFLVGYSLNSKAFRVYNLETKRVEENLHINFLENKPNVAGKGPNWLFDLDYLTDSMNYQPVRSENQANKTAGPKEANHSAGTQDNVEAGNSEIEADPAQDYFVLPIYSSYTSTDKSSEAKNEGVKHTKDTGLKTNEELVDQEDQAFLEELERLKRQEKEANDAAEVLRKEFAQMADFTNLESTVNEELLQFKIQKVWILVDLSYGKKEIGTKWVYRNKQDERGVVVRNKARIQAIRIFLAFASYMGFIVYQMDVKSAFLYGTINEEVYVSQPLGFVDPKFPKKVYKVVKALYSLHQAPRAWYATLSTFLLKSGYRRGTIDKTLFIKKDKNDIMLVQVYVDDIIFGSTKRSWCDEFEALMKSRFQMSSMGELTFFLGLQVKQKEDGIFISRDKYVVKILKKFNFDSVKTASTPIKTYKPLFRMRKQQMWMYIFIESDYGSANLDRKSTTGGCQFLGHRLISWQCKKQTIVATSTTEAEYVAAANCCGQNLVFHSKTKHIEIRHHFIRDAYEKKLIQVLKIHTDDNVADLLTKAFDVSRRWVVDDMMTFEVVGTAGTKVHTARHQELASPEQTASALAIPGQTTTGKESSNPLMADSLPKTIQSNDPPLSRGYTLGSGEDSLELMELMAYCTNLCEFVSKKNREIKVVTPLFDTMLAQGQSQSSTPQTSPSKITSSPSLSPQTHQPSPSPHPIDTTHHTEESTQMPHESPLHSVHSLGRDEGSLSLNELTLILKVKKLEKQVQTTNSRRKTKNFLSEVKDATEDPSNQGRIIEEINADTYIILVTPIKVSSQSDQSEDHLRVLSAAKVLEEAAKQGRSVGLTQTSTIRRRKYY
ncbi:retrovirus-related pol polyprotein from transposon TNT 1-94 [Tanacetum coccineum]